MAVTTSTINTHMNIVILDNWFDDQNVIFWEDNASSYRTKGIKTIYLGKV